MLKLAGRCPLLGLEDVPGSWDPGTIDLSELEWITPFEVAGLAALWTRLQQDGRAPEVILPSDGEVRAYLVDIGVSDLVPGDWGDGGGSRVEPPWLRLVRLSTGEDWDDMAQEVWPRAVNLLGDVKLTRHTMEAISELIDNAATHGRSSVGTLVCAQRYTGATSHLSPGIWIGIADAGVGVPAHLRRNPKYRDIAEDEQLIRLAKEPGVTGTSDQRGWGLPEAFDDATEVGPSRVVIRSGHGEGAFLLRQGRAVTARYRQLTPALPGTWVHLRVGGA
jgi:hypothetical protein